jgi:hypothetical protein
MAKCRFCAMCHFCKFLREVKHGRGSNGSASDSRSRRHIRTARAPSCSALGRLSSSRSPRTLGRQISTHSPSNWRSDLKGPRYLRLSCPCLCCQHPLGSSRPRGMSRVQQSNCNRLWVQVNGALPLIHVQTTWRLCKIAWRCRIKFPPLRLRYTDLLQKVTQSDWSSQAAQSSMRKDKQDLSFSCKCISPTLVLALPVMKYYRLAGVRCRHGCYPDAR